MPSVASRRGRRLAFAAAALASAISGSAFAAAVITAAGVIAEIDVDLAAVVSGAVDTELLIAGAAFHCGDRN